MNPLTLLRNFASRIVAAQEALTCGDTDEAFATLVDLEADVIRSIAVLCMEEAA